MVEVNERFVQDFDLFEDLMTAAERRYYLDGDVDDENGFFIGRTARTQKEMDERLRQLTRVFPFLLRTPVDSPGEVTVEIFDFITSTRQRIERLRRVAISESSIQVFDVCLSLPRNLIGGTREFCGGQIIAWGKL